MITIASRNVYMGRIEAGINILNDVEKAIENQNIPIRVHYVLNNKSAISLLTGNISEQTEQDLLTALYSTSSMFEKAIILCNLMIYMIQSKRFLEAEKVFKQIHSLELSQYNNIDLKFILLKNTLFYHTTQNNKKEMLQTREKLISFALSNDCPDDIRQHIISLLSQKGFTVIQSATEKPFFSQFPFQAEFIGYWQCEVCCDAQGKNHLKEMVASLGTMRFGS